MFRLVRELIRPYLSFAPILRVSRINSYPNRPWWTHRVRFVMIALLRHFLGWLIGLFGRGRNSLWRTSLRFECQLTQAIGYS